MQESYSCSTREAQDPNIFIKGPILPSIVEHSDYCISLLLSQFWYQVQSLQYCNITFIIFIVVTIITQWHTIFVYTDNSYYCSMHLGYLYKYILFDTMQKLQSISVIVDITVSLTVLHKWLVKFIFSQRKHRFVVHIDDNNNYHDDDDDDDDEPLQELGKTNECINTSIGQLMSSSKDNRICLAQTYCMSLQIFMPLVDIVYQYISYHYLKQKNIYTV